MKFAPFDDPYPASAGCYRIDVSQRLRIEEYQGKVGLADIRAILSAMVTDPDWSPDHHGLVDFSAAELEMSTNDVLRLGLLMRQERNRTRGWLVFVVSNSVAFGVVRMLGYWSRSTDRMRIFQSRDEAEGWLQRQRDKAPPAFREPAMPVAREELLAAV
jgi:hypothetical protein